MILTEAEAGKRQCRILAATTPEGGTAPTRCVASGCAHWRWAKAKETAAFLTAVAEHMRDTKKNFNQATQAVFSEHKLRFEATEGYCGLAGRPD